MCFSKKEFANFLEATAKEIHTETWYAFRNGQLETGNIDWHMAKAKENLIGEIIREYQETHSGFDGNKCSGNNDH